MGFLLLPIYTNYFSKAEIGFLSTYESLGRMIVFLISLYLDAAFIRFFYKEKADKHQNIPLFFSTHFWFVVVWGGIAAFVITLSVTKIVRVSFFNFFRRIFSWSFGVMIKVLSCFLKYVFF